MRRSPLPVRTAVATGVAVLLAACGGSGGDQTIQPSPDDTSPGATSPGAASPGGIVTPGPITETAAEPTGAGAGADCSAGDMAVAAVQPPGVPEPAAETWNAIRDAALACDYERLAGIAPEDFSFSFGAADDPAAYWREAEVDGIPVLADLVRILGLPHGVDDDGDLVWPRVHVEPEDDSAWEEVADLYPADVIAEWREGSGSYLGHRTAIAPDGTWLYFIAGD